MKDSWSATDLLIRTVSKAGQITVLRCVLLRFLLSLAVSVDGDGNEYKPMETKISYRQPIQLSFRHGTLTMDLEML